MIAQIFAVVIFLALPARSDVHSDHHRSMGKTYCYAGMCAPYIDSCIWNLYAQPLSNY